MARFLDPGHHVKACRGLYDHHGIYIGKFAGHHLVAELAKPSDGGVARFVPWEVFSQGNRVDVVEHADGVAFDQVVKNVWQARECKRYDLIDWNCEHFATWCATHTSRSLQVEGVASAALLVLACLIVSKLAA